jgi:hypothetical protein
MQLTTEYRMRERTKMHILKYALCFPRNILCLLAAMIFCVNTFGNPADSTEIKPYHVNYPVVGVIIAGGMISDVFAISRIKGKTDMTDEELLFLNSPAQRDLINPIDRWALRQNASDRKRFQQISDIGQVPMYLLPGLLMFNKNIRKDWLDLMMIYLEGHTITFTFYNYSFLGPTFQNRYRPVAYYPEFANNTRESGNNRNSFYSGHVASSAYSTFFMAKVYCDYHPDMGAEKYLWYVAAAVPPLLMGYARVKALDHFPSDGAVGLALGAAIGIIVPELHKNPRYKNLSLGMFSSSDAMGLSIRWKLPYQQFGASGR